MDKRFFSFLAHADPIISIGRARTSDIQVGRYASTKHCEIEHCERGASVLRDLDSRNGTWVNGVRIAESVTLTPGMYITVGTSELIVLDEKRIPVTARGVTTLLTRAAEYYGSDRKAAAGTKKISCNCEASTAPKAQEGRRL